MKAEDATMGSGWQLLVKCLIILTVALLAACAATSTTVMDEAAVTNQKPMSSYKFLIVREFELKRELYSDSDTRMGSRERRYAQVPARLAENIQRYVRSKNIYQEVSGDGTATDATLILKGKFTKMGRFRISIEAVLLDGATGREVAYFRQTLWDVFDTTVGIDRLAHEIADFIDSIQYK